MLKERLSEQKFYLCDHEACAENKVWECGVTCVLTTDKSHSALPNRFITSLQLKTLTKEKMKSGNSRVTVDEIMDLF